jgi:penicillin-binding protein 1A
MRALTKIVSLLIGALLLLLASGLLWLYHYSRDLPDISVLAQYAPDSVSKVSDPCIGNSIAISYDSIGRNLTNALNAAEIREDDPGVLAATYQGFSRKNQLHRATLSWQISRSMFCSPSRLFTRSLAEFRTAAQLEQHFSPRELFTIYANRAYVGSGLIGVQAAALNFFHKDPADLDIGEAALIAGVIKSPALYSPLKHSDRAVERRNEVLDAMVAIGTINSTESENAKAAPLVVYNQTLVKQ